MYKDFAAQLEEDQYEEEMTAVEPMASAEDVPALEDAEMAGDNETALPHYECFRF